MNREDRQNTGMAKRLPAVLDFYTSWHFAETHTETVATLHMDTAILEQNLKKKKIGKDNKGDLDQRQTTDFTFQKDRKREAGVRREEIRVNS